LTTFYPLSRQNPRSKESYLEKLSGMADSTKQNFKSTYDSFDKFCQKKYNQTAEEKILEIPQDEDSEYDILQAWVNWLGKSALSIEKFSIPHVSGIHIVSGLYCER